MSSRFLIPTSITLLVNDQIQDLEKQRDALNERILELQIFLDNNIPAANAELANLSGIEIAIHCLKLKGKALNRADIKNIIGIHYKIAEDVAWLSNKTSVALTTEKSREDGRLKSFKINGTEYFGLKEWFNADYLFKENRPIGYEDVEITTKGYYMGKA